MWDNNYRSWSVTIAVLILTLILAIVGRWFRRNFLYWSRTNVPYIASCSLIGNIHDMLMFKKSAAEVLQDLYKHSEMETEAFVGIRIFHKPCLLVRDPALIKQILIKDFNYFSNRYTSSDPHSDGLGSYNLFFMKNPLWKQIRTNLTPIFTSGKMKQLFNLVNDIGKHLDQHLCEQPVDKKTNRFCTEIKELCALYTTDVIASAAFGIEANSIANPNSDFRKNGRKIFDFTLGRALEFTTFFFMPQFVSLFKCKVFSKESTEFLRSTFNYILDEREKTKNTRNDLVDLLLSLKQSAKIRINDKDVKMTDDILLAQAATFFTAGYETTASTMSFGLYELSKHQTVQKRLRDEIFKVLESNRDEITYDIILNMKYLHMVVQEVLRLYPPVPFLDRECTLPREYINKGYSLEPISNFSIPDKMPVYIPIYAIQRDEKYFPNPDEFDPERFSPENKDSIVPYSYLPFGTGGRSCIGERFGLMQAKVGLFYFLKNHYVTMSPKTHRTMKLEKKALIIQAEGGIHCDIVRDPLIK